MKLMMKTDAARDENECQANSDSHIHAGPLSAKASRACFRQHHQEHARDCAGPPMAIVMK